MRILVLCLVLAFSDVSGQDLAFCGEKVPLEEEGVRNRLKDALKRNIKDTGNLVLKEKIKLYLPYFAIVLKEYQLPDDLKYIPLAESRLQRRVTSSAGACGTWQFMAQTAISEGLTPEQRSSIIKSTHAACRLLKKLYRQLHSWPLAVAAYNYGSGNIRKATTRQQTDNFYRLHLNQETSNYIFNLTALKIIYGDKAANDTVLQTRHESTPPASGWEQTRLFHTTEFSNPKTTDQ